MRQYILDNIKMWLTDYHVDGFRLDSTIFIRNVRGLDNSPESDLADAWKLLGSICELAHETNPQALMIAEDCAGNGKLTSPVEEGGCGFDAQWDLSLPHTLRRALGNTPGALNDLCYSLFLNFNNDAMQKVVFADSHDSAANGSDRITEDAHFGTDDDILEQKMSVLAAAVALTVPGIPMILQGQEFMQGGSFNDWQELEWEKVDGYAAVVEANRQLINLRRDRYDETRGLTGNRISIFHRNDDNFVLGYRRDGDEDETDDVLVIVNFSETDIANYYMVLPSSGVWSVRFNCGHSQVEDLQTDENGGVSFALDGYAALILSKNRG